MCVCVCVCVWSFLYLAQPYGEQPSAVTTKPRRVTDPVFVTWLSGDGARLSRPGRGPNPQIGDGARLSGDGVPSDPPAVLSGVGRRYVI